MNDFVLPETRYALSGDVNIAYQMMGDGPIDIIMVPGFISHVEFTHELAGYTAFLRRLSTFARAARVMAQSQSREVLVSRVVTDLVAGAGLKFAERGSHELKGLPGRWDLFAASA